jgi:hypothetical protein
MDQQLWAAWQVCARLNRGRRTPGARSEKDLAALDALLESATRSLADRVLIVPPTAASATSVFHALHHDFDQTPNSYRQLVPAWQHTVSENLHGHLN